MQGYSPEQFHLSITTRGQPQLMILRKTDNYIKACMNTWLLCEACIHSELKNLLPKEKLIKSCRNCAQSCLSVVALFINDPVTVQKNVFDCFLYCRECYNECMQHPEEDIEHCGSICDHCADTIKELMFFHLN